jgi:hypothetical protein
MLLNSILNGMLLGSIPSIKLEKSEITFFLFCGKLLGADLAKLAKGCQTDTGLSKGVQG